MTPSMNKLTVSFIRIELPLAGIHEATRSFREAFGPAVFFTTSPLASVQDEAIALSSGNASQWWLDHGT